MTQDMLAVNESKEDSLLEEPAIYIGDLSFQYPLRRYQKEIIELIHIKLARGEKKLHIVAPPGSGKTIIGLQIISEFCCPSLVVSPNTTIQSQWGQKVNLFLPPDTSRATELLIGDHTDRPLKPITLLTYQVLSVPEREQEYLQSLAHKAWLAELLQTKALTAGQAELRIFELMQNNPQSYAKEMSRHTSRLRRKLTEILKLEDVLHDNALELVQALRRQKFGLVIFDECHHLTDYWASVMIHLTKALDDPVIVGLTGTPPEGKSNSQETRYLSLVGDIDYQVPTCALVKEGGLAPFQDLVYFTTPTEVEMTYLETQHESFHALLAELTTTCPDEKGLAPLSSFISRRLKDSDCDELLERKPELARAMTRYCFHQKLALPEQVELSESLRLAPFLDDWILLLEDYALNCLKVSADSQGHVLYDRIKSSVRKLGWGLTEKGMRRQASPVDRVMAFSKNKPEAVAKILEWEYANLANRLRSVVVCDFERMSALEVKGLQGVLDSQAGGAIAVLLSLMSKPISQFLNPCLVTGNHLLVDKSIASQFVQQAKLYMQEEGLAFDLNICDQAGTALCEISACCSDWETRLYVGMATSIFERGITKCLIGTRGIFGEGWDSQSLNTLIDLTTTCSPVSVKQLRGRSIRINASDPLDARKVANNWDVICIAPELEKGLNDYLRFTRKHNGFFGMADDGQIECGAGHVHPSFSELTPAEVFASSEDLNNEMLNKSLCRGKIYELWQVGKPYLNRSLGCVEVSGLRKLALTPPHIRLDVSYKAHVKELRSELNGIWWEYLGIGGLLSAISYFVFSVHAALSFVVSAAILVPFVLSVWLSYHKYLQLFNKLKRKVCQPNTQDSSLFDMGAAILSSLIQVKLLPPHLSAKEIKVTARSDGSFRVFLDNVESDQAQYFSRSFKEVLEPITNQPYIIPKYEFSCPQEAESKTKQHDFFKLYLSGNAKPRINSYHAVPRLLARSERGREAFEAAWNKYVSPGFIVATEDKPELLQKYFGLGPSLSERLLWE